MTLAVGMYFSESFCSFSLEGKRTNGETVLKNVLLHVVTDSQQKEKDVYIKDFCWISNYREEAFSEMPICYNLMMCSLGRWSIFCTFIMALKVSKDEKHVVLALFLHQKNFFFCPFYACFQRLKMKALFLQ